MDKASFLTKAIRDKRLAIGGHVFLTDPSISEAMASFGYDFIWIDGEHGPFDKEKLLAHIVATNAGGAAALVRVPANDPALIKPVLEMGPDGIIVPMVCTAEEAKKAISACRYPPAGIRGFGPRRANRYGTMPIAEYLAGADTSFLKIVQIEHVDAVRNLSEILAVDGLDAVIIGPNDLSASIGKLGYLGDPEVVALYDEIVATCKREGKPCGVSIGPGDKQFIREWIERGVDFISCGDDISFLALGAAQTLGFIRDCRRQR
ncbi:MAG: aldolase/citrate lyase family protein [Spirochaetes bacterium]|nr:aldolase/citrate lyase family protein [Spirochaetota bacterium]